MKIQLLYRKTICGLLNLLSFRKYLAFLFFALFFMMTNMVTAQVTIYSEDFENPSFPDQTNLSNTNTTGWNNVSRNGNNNRWWILGGSSINAISGDYALAVSRNSPHTGGGAKPRYNGGSSSENIAQSPLIDATGYTSVTLDFDWICEGESSFDFGRVAYSLDGTNWVIINQDYVLQSTAQSVTNLDLSAVDGQQFYLGFYWENDGSVTNQPSFVVDNIVVKGSSLTIPPPANDNCSNAVILTPSASCSPVIGTTIGATESLTGCSGTANDDVWYSFIATTDSHTISVESITIQNIVFEVFDGSCAGTSLVCENSTAASQAESTTLTGLTLGASYFVRVYSFSSNTSQDGAFSLCITSPPPANDDCSGTSAERLTPSPVCDPTFGTTIGATQTQSGCSGTADDDVWYFFRATRSQHTVVVEAGTINDIVFEVFVNGCGGSSLLCENSTSGSSTESATIVGLNVGTSYRVRVYSASGNVNDRGTFSICVLDLCIPSTELGTDTLACPSVDAGGVGLSGADAELSCSGGTAILEANYLELGETTSYNVDPIDFNPPYQFNCLEFPISVNVDDVWSDKIDLPFNFCFYGNTYDSVVIGSNGVISFDADRLAGSYAGWRIYNDIPSNVNSDSGYFGPSIFGVHHDVDPSKGGEIGYQLITLDSGCRALVAAWDEVPMYANNSILYTGMMVFYEDTNIIDVYIKEKNIDSGPWNNGRANLGLQASATAGLLVTGTNISNQWTANEQAYRFTPAGASITTLRWYENAIAPGNLIPDPDNDGLIEVSPTETTTYIAEVTYDLCNSVVPLVETETTTVTIIGKKTWNGSQNQAWDNPNNWTPIGIPLSTNCVTIPGTANNPIMPSNINGNAFNLTVNAGATLTQESNSTLTIEDNVTINSGGTYNLEDSASLIQVEDINSNTIVGTFNMERITNIRSNDYVYWSAPVTNFNIEDVSPGTPNGFKYQWLPTANRTPGPPGPLNYGEWESYNSGAMDVGRGYIIKGPTGHSSSPSPFSTTFLGSPNNGEVVQPIERGDYQGGGYVYNVGGDNLLVTEDDDNWNLIGNPYPSAINAADFLLLPANANIDGAVYLWTHGTDISTGNADPFYQDYAYNYNVADYILYNSSGSSTPSGFNGNIGAGQGFFVLMNDDSGNTTESVTFNNSMRNSTYANDQFYRNSDTNNSEDKSRIWLDYISPNGGTNTTLIAYVDGATNDADRMFDAVKSQGVGLNLYSLIGEKNYLIQGRQLPFEDNDSVRLGINITEPGTQTIAINTIEGLFIDSNQDIFIEDLENGIIHNLKESPFTFSSEVAVIDDRFILKYRNNSLGIDDFDTASGIKVFNENELLSIKSFYEPIASVEVFDILGRSLFSESEINLTRMTINDLKPEQRVLFLKIILTDGKQKIVKLMF